MGVDATLGLLADAIDSVASFVDVFIVVYIAPDPRLHHHVVDPAAVLALAEPDPALPLRRLRAVPAALPPVPAAVGPLDLSPMVGVIVLLIVQSVVVRLLTVH